MAARIRLKRLGRRNLPFYRVGVFDARSPRDGRTVEEIGTYDPHGETLKQKINIKEDRLAYWLSVGAQPTDGVKKLIKQLKRA